MLLEITSTLGVTIFAHLIHIGIGGVVSRRVFWEVGFSSWKFNNRLYLHKEGSGEPILFLHGLTGSWRYWRRGVKKLGTEHTLYCPDLLGFGRSPKPRGWYTSAEHINALEPILKEDNRKWTIMAHSMGATVAIGMLARHPQKIKRLVLIGLPYYPSREIAEIEFKKNSLISRLIVSRSPFAPLVCYLKDILGLPFFAPLARTPVDLYRDYWKHTWNSASRSLFNTVINTNIKQILKDIGVENRKKIILVHGTSDTTSVVEHVRELVAFFPEITLQEMEGDHQIYLEKPDAINNFLFA